MRAFPFHTFDCNFFPKKIKRKNQKKKDHKIYKRKNNLACFQVSLKKSSKRNPL